MTSSLAWQWLFVRLSPRFSVPFLSAAGAWMFAAFPWLLTLATPHVRAYRPRLWPGVWEAAHAPALAVALTTGVLAAAGLLASLWAATAVYRAWPPRVVIWHRPGGPSAAPSPPPAAGRLGDYERIGIILAGGGAKGAYQAGALAAIHDFLDERGALGSVKMIAGTSIGAWNACFWLAGQVAGEDSVCERWWSRIRLSEVVAPTFYLPVFASMDLPPLFEHVRMGDEVFEDGGVVDNLPIFFGTGIEKCDLLFLLPLNASFTRRAGERSVLKRIERVMTIRQGALERKALKDVYLYNELAVLRDRLDRARPVAPAAESGAPSGSPEALREASEADLPERAARRVHRPVQVFAICPDEPLLLDTIEFWKTGAAGRAFRLMREYTRYELDEFDFTGPPNWIRVALIGPEGEVRYLEDF